MGTWRLEESQCEGQRREAPAAVASPSRPTDCAFGAMCRSESSWIQSFTYESTSLSCYSTVFYKESKILRYLPHSTGKRPHDLLARLQVGEQGPGLAPLNTPGGRGQVRCTPFPPTVMAEGPSLGLLCLPGKRIQYGELRRLFLLCCCKARGSQNEECF